MSKEATLSGRLSERTTRRDCVKLESMNAEATWYDGTWNDWRWRTPDRFLSPRVQQTLKVDGRGTTFAFSNQDLPQWNSLLDVTGNDPRQSGDERGRSYPIMGRNRGLVGGWLVLTPAKGKPKKRPRVGRWRQLKGTR